MTERLVLWHRWLPPRHPDAEAHGAVARWRRAVEGHLTVSGATLLGSVGASVAAAFDSADVIEVAELSLELLDEAEEAAIAIAIGLAVGEVETIDGAVIGAAVERAQLFANRARAGEVVLDPGARDAVADTLLFGRQVSAGTGAPRGTTLDRTHPHRLACADAIRELGATTLPPVIATVRAQIEEALSEGTSRTFLLRGPVGAGTTELIGDLERRMAPEQVLRIGAAPGGVVPLASLRLALMRRFHSPEKVLEAFNNGGATTRAADVMARVAAGDMVPMNRLADALEALLVLATAGAARPWIVLSPLGLVDGATLAALLEARARGGDFVMFGRLPVETAPPRPLAELDEAVTELTLPPLKVADARVVAEAVLGHSTDDDVARRVAVLGGDTVLGVVEAARTLIATGDLVHHGDGFVWRAGPRSGVHAIGTDALLSERLELLDAHARRVLEALCVVPDGSPRALLAAVVVQDEVPAARIDASLELLAREALARGRERPRPATSLLRWRVLSLIPPARSMELHRFVGEALRASTDDALPRRVERGYFLVEGGLESEGRALITEALEPLVSQGYERAARQLSGWLTAVHEHALAANDAGRATPTPPPPDAREEPPPSSELALDELLEEIAEEDAASAAKRAAGDRVDNAAARLPPPPPPAALRKPAALQKPATLPKKEPAPPAPPPPPEAAVPASAQAPPEGEPSRPRESSFASSIPPPPGEAAAARLAETAPGTLDAEVDALLDAAPSLGDATVEASLDPPEPGPIAEDAGLDAAVDTLLGAPWPAADDDGVVVDDAFPVERTSVAPAPMRPFVEEVVRAIRARDFDELERAIQRATAEGSDLGAVGRVRALAELARGDVSAARQSLQGARERGRADSASQARDHLAEALLDLHAGEPLAGVRAALSALAASRRLTDARGEAAALHALAACYRALGRDDVAARLRPPP